MAISSTAHEYHVKEVRAHSGAQLRKWIGWADQLTHIFDTSMFLPSYRSRTSTSVYVTWNETCVCRIGILQFRITLQFPRTIQ